MPADMAAIGNCNRIVLLSSLLLIAISAAKEYVPVLLLESVDNASNEVGVTALSKWSADDFKKYLLKLVDNNQDISKPPLVLVFAEESLSVEDFSWASVGDYGSYPRLLNISKSSNGLFFPSVHQPLKVLDSLRETGFKWVKYPSAHITKAITSGKYTNMFPKVTKDTKGIVLFIDMEDASTNEDRPDMLRRHDTFIVDTYETLKSDREVVAVYTADHSSWYDAEEGEAVSSLSDYEEDDDAREVRSSIRRLLAANEDDNDSKLPVLYNATKAIMLYSENYPTLYNEAETLAVQLKEVVSVTPDIRPQFQRMSVAFKGDGQEHQVTLRFRFEESRKYWSLRYVELETNNMTNKVTLKANMIIEAPFGFSYHCSQNITFSNDTYSLVFQGLQVQAYVEGELVSFGDGYDCVYFFTAAIWSGLFVTMLLAFIMIWGLSMIMDIRTMDRFDDPKGKTITIGAVE